MVFSSRSAIANPGAGNESFQAIAKGTSSKINFTGSSSQSSAFGEFVTIVRLFSTTDCYIEFGTNPTADSGDMFLPAGFIEYFAVIPGNKLAVIRDTTSGTLYITEGAA